MRRYLWPTHWSWDSRFATPEEVLLAGARAELHRQALVAAGSAFIDWVIAGCESGPEARPCSADWLRSLRDQCVAAEVPFFLKQVKEPPFFDDREDPREVGYPSGPPVAPTPDPIAFGPGSKRKRGGIIELPYLDGVQHAAFPAVRR